jgi:hypothetical protein
MSSRAFDIRRSLAGRAATIPRKAAVKYFIISRRAAMFAVAVLSSLNILAQHKNGSHRAMKHFYSFSREIRERMTATSLLFCAPHMEAEFFFQARTDVATASDCESATCAPHIHSLLTLIKQTCPFLVAPLE